MLPHNHFTDDVSPLRAHRFSALITPVSLRRELAAAPFLPNLPARNPNGAGQFGFANEHHVLPVLEKNGWENVQFNPIDFPTIPLTPEKIRMRNEHILTYAEHLIGKPSRVMIGDFNTAPWSPVITQSKSVAELRRLSPGISSTWLSTLPFLGLPIDHVLLGGNVSGKVKIGAAIGSDHFPIVIELSVSQKDRLEF